MNDFHNAKSTGHLSVVQLTVCHSLLLKIFLYTLAPHFLTTPCQPPCWLRGICLNSGRQSAPLRTLLLFCPHLFDDRIHSYDLKTIYVLLAPKYTSPAQISPLNSRLLSATAYFTSPPEIVLYF